MHTFQSRLVGSGELCFEKLGSRNSIKNVTSTMIANIPKRKKLFLELFLLSFRRFASCRHTSSEFHWIQNNFSSSVRRAFSGFSVRLTKIWQEIDTRKSISTKIHLLRVLHSNDNNNTRTPNDKASRRSLVIPAPLAARERFVLSHSVLTDLRQNQRKNLQNPKGVL